MNGKELLRKALKWLFLQHLFFFFFLFLSSLKCPIIRYVLYLNLMLMLDSPLSEARYLAVVFRLCCKH